MATSGPLNIARKSIGSRGGIGSRHIGRPSGQKSYVEPNSFPPGSYTFTPSVAGYWKFVGWGGGFSTGSSSTAGDSGAYIEITKYLTPTQPVTISVGGAGANTSFTFSDGAVATAGGATNSGGAGPGVATGGDVNLNGSAGAASSGSAGTAGSGTGGGASTGNGAGAGAPANLPYRGGKGAAAVAGTSPGAGGCTGTGVGGSGLGLALLVRDA